MRFYCTHSRLILLNWDILLIIHHFAFSRCLSVGIWKLDKFFTLRIFIFFLIVYQNNLVLKYGLFVWTYKILLNWSRISALLTRGGPLHIGKLGARQFISNCFYTLFLLIWRKFQLALNRLLNSSLIILLFSGFDRFSMSMYWAFKWWSSRPII